MSQPIGKAELLEREYDLHIKAGLVYSGMNIDGESEWIGTDKEWQEYEELSEAENL